MSSRAAAAIRAALPGAHVSLSHEVSPLWREYERASTTIADAFVKPVVSRYVERRRRVIDSRRLAAAALEPARLQRRLPAGRAGAKRPAQLLLSGLAGGVDRRPLLRRAGAAMPRSSSLDMGGTSCDIGLVARAAASSTRPSSRIASGSRSRIPCVAVQTIGAGGGSIAWIDKGGLLHVGPQSAGAEPGPVAYGRGGTEPTLTDANLVLGRLDPDTSSAARCRSTATAARAALARLGDAPRPGGRGRRRSPPSARPTRTWPTRSG